MALIKCPECGKEISDKAKACIHCGFPLDDIITEPQDIIIEPQALVLTSLGEYVGAYLWVYYGFPNKFRNITDEELPLIIDIDSLPSIQHKMSEDIEKLGGRVKKISLDNVKQEDIDKYRSLNVLKEKLTYSGKILRERPDLFEGVNIQHFHANQFQIRKIIGLDDEEKKDFEENRRKGKIRQEERRKMYNEQEVISNLSEEKKPLLSACCPNCGADAFSVETISTGRRVVSTALFGLASSDIGKTKRCKKCGYKW